MHRFGYKVENLVDTRANEMEPVLPALVVNELKLMSPRAEEDVSMLEILLANNVLRHDLNTTHELAKIDPIARRKDAIQKCRSETEYVKVEFPGFVVCVDFVCDVVWFTIERARNEHAGVLDGLPMCCPSVFIMEDCPVPRILVVSPTTLHISTPE